MGKGRGWLVEVDAQGNGRVLGLRERKVGADERWVQTREGERDVGADERWVQTRDWEQCMGADVRGDSSMREDERRKR